MSSQLVQRVAAKVVIQAEDGILVLHPSEIDPNRKWHIPGGIRDDIAEAVFQTGIREVKEETGLDISSQQGKVIRIGEWPAVDKGEKVKILAVFFHITLPQRPKITLSHEHDDYVWLTLENHKEYQANPEVHEVVEQLLKPA